MQTHGLTRIVAVIQARLTSTRFPRKVLETVGGRSLISRVCAAARDSRYIDKVAVVWAHKFMLEENDVLGRFRYAAMRHNARVIVRITSDCPLLEARHIDEAIEQYVETSDCQYFANFEMQDEGFDVQVFDASFLWGPYTHKEHIVVPGILKVVNGEGYPAGSRPHCWSIDTPADLKRVRAFAALRGALVHHGR